MHCIRANKRQWTPSINCYFKNSQDLQAIDLAIDLVPITQYLKVPCKTYTWYLTFIDVLLWKVPSLLDLADDPVARQAAEAILKVIDEEGAPCSECSSEDLLMVDPFIMIELVGDY